MKRKLTSPSFSFVLIVMLLAVTASCAPPPPQSSASVSSQPSVGKKQIVASIFSDPPGLQQELSNPTGAPSSAPGLQELYQLVNGTMTYLDQQSVRYAWLADAVPTVENGLWKVSPDGRMETTWRIRAGTRWHDGTPMTA